MNTKGKARQDAATSERAKGQEKHQAGGNSHDNFTTGHSPISRHLLEGRENAIPRRALEMLTGLDGRTVRLMIERERRQGIPILSDCSNGYYLPATEQERVTCVRSLRHRAREIMRTAKAIEGRTDKGIDGQIRLEMIVPLIDR